MLTQPSDKMWFFVCNIKLELWKLVCITKTFNIFVVNISILLNIILPFCPLLFTCPFFVFALINHSMFACCMRKVFLNSMDKLTSDVRVPVCIIICVSYPFAPGTFTFNINWNISLLSMALRSSTIYLSCSGALIPWSIIIEKYCDNIDNSYNSVAYM